MDLHSLQVQHKLIKVSDIPCGPLRTTLIVKACNYCLQSSEVHSYSPHTTSPRILSFSVSLRKKQSLAFFRDIFLPSKNARGILSALWESANSKHYSFSQKSFLRLQAFVDCLQKSSFHSFIHPSISSFILERNFLCIYFNDSNLSTAVTVHVLKAIF